MFYSFFKNWHSPKVLGEKVACVVLSPHLCTCCHAYTVHTAIGASAVLPTQILVTECYVQFSLVQLQDGICGLRKAQMRSAPSLRSFPSVAFEMIPMLFGGFWLTSRAWCRIPIALMRSDVFVCVLLLCDEDNYGWEWSWSGTQQASFGLAPVVWLATV